MRIIVCILWLGTLWFLPLFAADSTETFQSVRLLVSNWDKMDGQYAEAKYSELAGGFVNFPDSTLFLLESNKRIFEDWLDHYQDQVLTLLVSGRIDIAKISCCELCELRQKTLYWSYFYLRHPRYGRLAEIIYNKVSQTNINFLK